MSFRTQALVSSRQFDSRSTQAVNIISRPPYHSTLLRFCSSQLLLLTTLLIRLTSPFDPTQLSRMPSKPAKRTTATPSSSSRQVASSPTLTSLSSLSSAAMSKNASSPQMHTSTSNYNPSAIESWMDGVSSKNANNIGRKDSSNSASSMQMQDPAVQAYMGAKMGLFQQSTHSHHSQSHTANGNN